MPTGPHHFPASGLYSISPIWRRAAARAIDTLIVAIPALVIGIIGSGFHAGDQHLDMPRWASVVWVGLAVAYEVPLLAWRGQTVGKLAVGIKVARLDNGRPPLWWQ